jgi:hypothetical protein
VAEARSSPTHRSSPLTPPPPPLIGGRTVCAVDGSGRVGERTAGSSSSFRGPEWRRRVRRLHTEVVAIDAATAATHRWTDGARGRRFGSVWGNGRRGRPRLLGDPSGGGAFVAHTPKSSASTPPLPPLIGGQTVRAVDGLEWCGGTDGGVVLVFQGARVAEACSSPTHRSRHRRHRHRRHS